MRAPDSDYLRLFGAGTQRRGHPTPITRAFSARAPNGAGIQRGHPTARAPDSDNPRLFGAGTQRCVKWHPKIPYYGEFCARALWRGSLIVVSDYDPLQKRAILRDVTSKIAFWHYVNSLNVGDYE